MNDDELKKLWQQQPLRVPDVSAEQLVSAMQKQTSQLRRTLDARDLRELVACAVLIIIFGILYFTVYRNPISRVGDLIIIGSLIFIAWKLVHTRRMTPPAPPGATVVESLRAELNAVRAQSRLLGVGAVVVFASADYRRTDRYLGPADQSLCHNPCYVGSSLP